MAGTVQGRVLPDLNNEKRRKKNPQVIMKKSGQEKNKKKKKAGIRELKYMQRTKVENSWV